ncbi:Vps52 / Sac2 family protein [Sesbania bispinosa]|nr:Vps52 / Sac2 family protein [Sesbania bispinosa]
MECKKIKGAVKLPTVTIQLYSTNLDALGLEKNNNITMEIRRHVYTKSLAQMYVRCRKGGAVEAVKTQMLRNPP